MLFLLTILISKASTFDIQDQYSIQSIDYKNEVLLEEETPQGMAHIKDLKDKAIAQRQDDLLNSNKTVHIKEIKEIKNTLRSGYAITSSSKDVTMAEVESIFNKSEKVIALPKAGNQFDFYFLKKLNTKRMKLGAVLTETRYSKGCKIDLIFDDSVMKNYALQEGDVITNVNGTKVAQCNTFKYIVSKSKNIYVQYNRYGVLKEVKIPLK